MDLNRLIVSGLGIGFLPKAPGTWGSLLAVFIFLGLARLSFLSQVLVVVGISIIGVYSAGKIAKETGEKDPKLVVIDEIAGQLLALVGFPPKPLVLLTGFLIFRLLDIIKPPPIQYLERLPGGLGIMADDLLAGLVTNLILQIFIPILLS